MHFDTVDPFLRYFGSVRKRTRAVADAIPEEMIEASTGPGRVTAGDILRHIAGTERWMWAENAVGRPSRYPGHGRELTAGKQGVLDYLDRLHAESLEIFEGLGPERDGFSVLDPPVEAFGEARRTAASRDPRE